MPQELRRLSRSGGILPYLKIMNHCVMLMAKLQSELGFTPSARAALGVSAVPPVEETASERERFDVILPTGGRIPMAHGAATECRVVFSNKGEVVSSNLAGPVITRAWTHKRAATTLLLNRCQVGKASTMLTADLVGTTRASRNPALSRRPRYSGSVRS